MSKPRLKDETAAEPLPGITGQDRIERLVSAIADVKRGGRISPRTIKLLKSGTAKMAQKVIEEAAELGIEAVQGNRRNLVDESVDLLYNLAVLWCDLGVHPNEVWAEMDRRELMLGMAEKLPKPGATDES
jgi:phosphoribosyl-ATP pyrophosphohydrolase